MPWAYYIKIPICPMFYLLKGDYSYLVTMVIVQRSIQDFRRLICRGLKRGKLRTTTQLPNPRAKRSFKDAAHEDSHPTAAATKPNSFSQSPPLNTCSKTTSSTPKSRQPPYSALTGSPSRIHLEELVLAAPCFGHARAEAAKTPSPKTSQPQIG